MGACKQVSEAIQWHFVHEGKTQIDIAAKLLNAATVKETKRVAQHLPIDEQLVEIQRGWKYRFELLN